MNKTPFLKASIVTDLGFGDSGKGLVVDYLCSKIDSWGLPLVVRMNSGHQVGHTVIHNGEKHTFSNFGSGTLRGIPTYYGKNTVMYPYGFMNELVTLSREPSVIYHPLAMVATPYDVAWNQTLEEANEHGSVGVGYGATVTRNMDGVGLSVKDLFNDWVTVTKLQGIRDYYRDKATRAGNYENYLAVLRDNVQPENVIPSFKDVVSFIDVARLEDLIVTHDNLIFEGNQGICLDKFEGFYPHLTWADCTSRSALDWLSNKEADIEIFYVTRAYQNRHGNGPMSSDRVVDLINTKDEINVPNKWQGTMRTRRLDLDLLKWALTTDHAYFPENLEVKRSFVMTCVDQLKDFSLKYRGKGHTFDTLDSFLSFTKGAFSGLKDFYVSRGPTASDITLLKEPALTSKVE